jgi:dihydropyrimidinase
VKRNERNLLNQGIVGPEGYIMSHTEEAEEEATLRACTLANQMNCPLYLSHISSTSTVEIVSAKKKKGHVVYAEVSPAALAGDGEAYWDKDWKKAAASVTSPPIRKEQNQGLIEKLVEEDTGLDLVGSNHAAFNANQKALGQTDFTKIPGLCNINHNLLIDAIIT